MERTRIVIKASAAKELEAIDGKRNRTVVVVKVGHRREVCR